MRELYLVAAIGSATLAGANIYLGNWMMLVLNIGTLILAAMLVEATDD